MKKRITALLLCLVMVLSLIPTTVWAAGSVSYFFDVRLLSGSGYFMRSNGDNTKSDTFRVSQHVDSTIQHTVTARFVWNASAGGDSRYSKYHGGWQLYVDIDGTSYAQEAYVYSYDMADATTSYTTDISTIPGSSQNTIIKLDITAGAPKAPDARYVEYEDWVNLVCTTKDDATPNKCSLINGTYTIGEVTGNYAKRCTITIKDDDECIGKYVAKVDGHQAGTGHDRTITLKLENGEWVLNENDTATINVTCDNGGQTEPPTAPTQGEIKNALEGKNFLINDIRGNPYDHGDKIIPIKKSDLNDAAFFREATVTELQKKYPEKKITSNPYIDSEGNTVYVLRVNGSDKLQSYIDDYNADPKKGNGVEHEYDYHDYTFLKKNVDGTWYVSGYIATIDVKCETAPAAPTEDDLVIIPGAVHVYCKDVVNDHSFYTTLKRGTFTTANSKVTKIGGVYTYTVTLKDGVDGSASYIAERNKAYPYYHTEAAEGRRNTVTFTWDSSSREWVIVNPETDAAIIPVECHMPTDAELAELLKGLVTVDCSLIPNHGPHTYDTDVATLKPLTIQKDTTGTISCTVELNSAKLGTYVEKYNEEDEFFNYAPHEVDANAAGTDLTVKLVWNAADNKWTVDKGDTFKIITKCKLAPKVPTADELKNLENAVLVQCRGMNAHDPDAQSYKLIDGTYVTNWKDPDTGETGISAVYWDEYYNAWSYNVFMKLLNYEGVDGFIPYIKQFNKTTDRYHDEYDIYSNTVQLILDEKGVWTVADPATVFVTCPPAAPTVDELNKLDLTVSVSCKNKPTTHRTHSFDLADGYFSTEVFLGEDGVYFCRVTLTKADAKHYVSQFDKITSKSHKVSKVEGEILLRWVDNTPSPTALTLNDGNEEEVPSYTYWELKDQSAKTLIITATCTTSTTPGGNNIGPAKNPYIKEEPKKVESGKTFDAGIALYVGLGVLSVTGSAMVIRKKKEF